MKEKIVIEKVGRFWAYEQSGRTSRSSLVHLGPYSPVQGGL